MENKELKKFATLEQALNNKNFAKEFEAVIINNDKPITITKKDYQVIEGEPQYTDAEKNGRSGGAVAVISQNTVAVYTSDHIEYPEPINWSKAIQELGIYERCHTIGYKLSAKNSEIDNIFIGTKHLNKPTMYNIEKVLCDDIQKDKRTYLYKVTPIYKGKEDIVPFGILIEAETIDDKEKKQLCRFCYNIQDSIKINYYDGSDKPLKEVYGKREEYHKKKTKNEELERDNKYQRYDINIKTGTFHLSLNKCKAIQKTEPKYIQGTKAFYEDVIKANEEKNKENTKNKREFRFCKRCTDYHK